MDWHEAKALLEWYVELGVSEAIGESPVNCYELPQDAPRVAKPAAAARPAGGGGPAPKPAAAPAPPPERPAIDYVAEARKLADGADSLPALRAALESFDGCELKRGARNFVFADGRAGARVMVIGDPPTPEEDRAGKPFVEAQGALFDKMFAAIGRSRTAEEGAGGLYVAPMLPWRAPPGREPSADELAMILPFLQRHIELAAPDVLVLMGNAACQALLGKSGIRRLRGTWVEAAGRPALPMTHPSFLLRNSEAKRDAWADLLAVQAKLREL